MLYSFIYSSFESREHTKDYATIRAGEFWNAKS